jgi:hypothetical protein
MKWLILSCTLLLFLMPACTKECSEEFEFFVFGHFYGECLGEQCVEIFKISQNALYEDSKDMYPGQDNFYSGDYFQLSNELYLLTKDIHLSFPEELWKETNTVIGQPDAGDWGGLYIEMKNSEGHDFWLLDKKMENIPLKYHAFIDSISLKIAQING